MPYFNFHQMMFTIFDRLGTLKEQKLAISALRLIIVD